MISSLREKDKYPRSIFIKVFADIYPMSKREDVEKRAYRIAPRREKYQILLEVLRGCVEEEKPTRLMYKTNLSWATLHKYLDTLVEDGYIDEISLGDRRKVDKRCHFVYKTSEKGTEFLRSYGEFEKGLRDVFPTLFSNI